MPGPAGQHTLILQQERATKKVTGGTIPTTGEVVRQGSKPLAICGAKEIRTPDLFDANSEQRRFIFPHESCPCPADTRHFNH